MESTSSDQAGKYQAKPKQQDTTPETSVAEGKEAAKDPVEKSNTSQTKDKKAHSKKNKSAQKPQNDSQKKDDAPK